MADVLIIDSGGANLASLELALGRLGATSIVTADPSAVTTATRVILPGVGSAADAMARLRATGVDRALRAARQPVLGICLGMQLLYARSEEGDTECLGLLPETVRRLTPAAGRPVPHMGWNNLHVLREDPLLAGVTGADYVYFVHSYAAPVTADTLASCEYGVGMAAVVRHGNFRGVQFHPERSSRTGARILRNFLDLT